MGGLSKSQSLADVLEVTTLKLANREGAKPS